MNMGILIPITALMIPIVAILARFGTKWLELRQQELAQQTVLTAEKAAQYAAQTERLEARVRVLERIVTDQGIDVAAQIEALRDDRVN